MAVDPQRIHFFAAGDVGERIAKHDGEGRDGLSN
jgi:hypothetical protein